MTVMTEDDRMLAAWEQLREHMIGARSGDVAVTDVRIEHCDYPQDGEIVEITRVTLVLTDPPHPDIWPPGHTRELRTRTYQASAEFGILPPAVVHVTTRPGYEDDIYGPAEED